MLQKKLIYYVWALILIGIFYKISDFRCLNLTVIWLGPSQTLK